MFGDFFGLSRIRRIINRERVYFLMLSFIILLNAWFIFAQKIPAIKIKAKEARLLPVSASEKKAENKFEPRAYEKFEISDILEKNRNILIYFNIIGTAAILIFSLGLYLDIRLLMARIKKRRIVQFKGRHTRIKWKISDIFRLVLIFVFIGYILQIMELSIFKNTPSFLSLINTGIIDLLFLGIIIYFVKVKYGHKLSAIGLKIKGTTRNILVAILGYVAFLPILFLLLLAVVWLAAVFNYHPSQQPLFRLFLEERNFWVLVYSTIMVVFLGPVVEEVFFRGFTYNVLKKRWGTLKAMFITALVFAGLHANLIGFFPIAALGFLLAYLYEKTGTLVSAITVHVLHNSIMVFLLFIGRYLVQLTQ